MNKYKVFRSFGNADKNIRMHELVAVEYGDNIHEIEKQLMRIVTADASELPQYQSGYTATAYAPEPVEAYRKVKRYTYIILAVLCPEFGEKNELIEYGIIEEPDGR